MLLPLILIGFVAVASANPIGGDVPASPIGGTLPVRRNRPLPPIGGYRPLLRENLANGTTSNSSSTDTGSKGLLFLCNGDVLYVLSRKGSIS